MHAYIPFSGSESLFMVLSVSSVVSSIKQVSIDWHVSGDKRVESKSEPFVSFHPIWSVVFSFSAEIDTKHRILLVIGSWTAVGMVYFEMKNLADHSNLHITTAHFDMTVQLNQLN